MNETVTRLKWNVNEKLTVEIVPRLAGALPAPPVKHYFMRMAGYFRLPRISSEGAFGSNFRIRIMMGKPNKITTVPIIEAFRFPA
jgi:hypothetical protein